MNTAADTPRAEPCEGNACFRNPRLLVLALLLIVVAGLSSFELLPRREDPRITPRFALVLTRLPGEGRPSVIVGVARSGGTVSISGSSSGGVPAAMNAPK